MSGTRTDTGAAGGDTSEGDADVLERGSSAPGGADTLAAGAEHTEIELKYSVLDGPAVDTELRGPLVPGLTAGPERLVEMEDSYLDTPDRAVERAGYAARLRHGPGGPSLELKTLTRSDPESTALHRRTELTGPAGEGTDPRDWPPSQARESLLAWTGDSPLAERFRIFQRRRRWDLEGEGRRVEMSLDDVEVVHHGRVAGRRTVLEAELAAGPESTLAELAAALEATGRLVPDERSKFELAVQLAEGAPASADGAPQGVSRGARSDAAAEQDAAAQLAGGVTAEQTTPTVAGGQTGPADAAAEQDAAAQPAAAGAQPAAAGATLEPSATSPMRTSRAQRRAALVAELRGQASKSPGVLGDDTLAEAGRKVLRFHLARMLAQEEAARSGDNPDPVHDMRVATRRMRAAWRVFGGAFRPRLTRRYVAELRSLAGALGAVRDLDVLLDALDVYAQALPEVEQEALRPLGDAWRQDQARARRELQAMLDSATYNRFVDDYVAFVRGERSGEIPVSATEPHRVRDTAGSRILAAYEQVRVYDAVLPWADLATLHQLRIAGKRLRYALEFFREPLGADAATLIERVVILQDHIGALHDNDVAASLARSFLVEHATRLSPQTIGAVGRYLTSREREVTRLRRTLGPVWRRLVAASYRRGLGRATGRL